MRVPHSLTRRALLLAAAAPLLAQAKSWDQADFPRWSEKLIDALLTDSPWARPLTVPFRLSYPDTARPVKAEVYLTIRWSSALPIRQALALQQSRDVAPDASEYVIEVFGIPATLAVSRLEQVQKELAASARLHLPGRRSASPESVILPGIGMHLAAAFRFPRWDGLQPASGAVEFVAEAAGLKIRQPFKLSEMLYRGRLEL